MARGRLRHRLPTSVYLYLSFSTFRRYRLRLFRVCTRESCPRRQPHRPPFLLLLLLLRLLSHVERRTDQETICVLTWNVRTAAAAIRKQADVLATLGRRFVDLRSRINRCWPRRRIPVDVDELLRFRHDLRRRFQSRPRSSENPELLISRHRSPKERKTERKKNEGTAFRRS